MTAVKETPSEAFCRKNTPTENTELSFASMVKETDKILNCTMINETETKTYQECNHLCLTNEACFSTNYGPLNQCQLLTVNKFENASLLVKKLDWQHYSIKVLI